MLAWVMNLGFAGSPSATWTVVSQDASVWTVQQQLFDDAKCNIAQCGDQLRHFTYDETTPASTTWTVQ